jgi:hypothetical protein
VNSAGRISHIVILGCYQLPGASEYTSTIKNKSQLPNQGQLWVRQILTSKDVVEPL